MPDSEWWTALWENPESVLGQLGIEPSMTVLDLCCGNGFFTAPLARLVRGNVYALDLDPAMIEQAKLEAERQGVSVRQWICADARALEKSLPEKVDYVLMANTFHGVPDQRGLVRAIREGLRPGGLFGIVNWQPLPREQTTVFGEARGPRTGMRMSVETVRAMVEPLGFRCVSVVDLPPYHYGIVFGRTD